MGAYMKLGSIKGEATDDQHKEWIEVLSVGYGVRREDGGGGGRTRARPEFSEVTCTKEMDKSSPLLMRAAASGEVFRNATIEFFGEGSDVDDAGAARTRASVSCGDVTVVSVRLMDTADDGSAPREEVSLNFEEIKWTYETAKGETVSTGWNLATNRPV